jgi:hypothetical protein
VYKPGETVKSSGKYIEYGHGGGRLKEKDRQTVELNEGDTFPELKPYDISYEHKNQTRTKTRQHKWFKS